MPVTQTANEAHTLLVHMVATEAEEDDNKVTLEYDYFYYILKDTHDHISLGCSDTYYGLFYLR